MKFSEKRDLFVALLHNDENVRGAIVTVPMLGCSEWRFTMLCGVLGGYLVKQETPSLYVCQTFHLFYSLAGEKHNNHSPKSHLSSLN